MRDAAGELSYGFHLLRLTQLRFELDALGVSPFACGDVAHDAQQVRMPLVMHLHPAHFDIDGFAVASLRAALAVKRLPAACRLPQIVARRRALIADQSVPANAY